MCGRFTVKMTSAEIVALYRLTLDRPPHNLQPRYNACPTDPIDVVTEQDEVPVFGRLRLYLTTVLRLFAPVSFTPRIRRRPRSRASSVFLTASISTGA